MKYILYAILGVLLWVGCDDTETLTSSTGSEPGYNLPQGDHNYDEKIVEWNKRTGIYILYKFRPQDLFFNLGQAWLELTVDTLERSVKYEIDDQYVQDLGEYAQIMTNKGVLMYYYGEGINKDGFPYTASTDGKFVMISETYIETGTANIGSFNLDLADEEYVGKQVDLVESTFLNFYPDKVLRKYAPFKVMLGKKLIYLGARVDVKKNILFISNMLVVNNGDESIDNFTVSQKKSIKNEINQEMVINRLYEDILKEVEVGKFFKVSNYETIKKQVDTLSVTAAKREYYKWGIISYGSYTIAKNLTLERIKTNDLKSYLSAIIMTPKTTLERNPSSAYYMGDAVGILTDKRDVNHKIRDKYDIVIKALSNLGIDLQSMGNYQ